MPLQVFRSFTLRPALLVITGQQLANYHIVIGSIHLLWPITCSKTNSQQRSLKQIMTSILFGIISAIFFKLNRGENSLENISGEESGIQQLLNRYNSLSYHSLVALDMCRYCFQWILGPCASEMSMKSALSLSFSKTVACSCHFFHPLITFLQYGVVFSVIS